MIDSIVCGVFIMFNSGFKIRARFVITRFGHEFDSLVDDMNRVLNRIAREYVDISNDRHFSWKDIIDPMLEVINSFSDSLIHDLYEPYLSGDLVYSDGVVRSMKSDWEEAWDFLTEQYERLDLIQGLAMDKGFKSKLSDLYNYLYDLDALVNGLFDYLKD